MINAEAIDEVLELIRKLLARQLEAVKAIPGVDVPAESPEATTKYLKNLYTDLRLIANAADGLATVLTDPLIG